MKKVLIAYTTKTGTTKEAATAIKETLEKDDFAVDLLTFEQASDLTPYGGVIVGAPINGFKWVPEAVQFIEKNQSYLKSVPTALFAMNYIGELGRPSIRTTILKGFKEVKTKIDPKSVQLFGGKIDKELPGFVRLMFGVKKGSPIDVTEPEAVIRWAEDLKDLF